MDEKSGKYFDRSIKIRFFDSTLRKIVNLQNECCHSQINTTHTAKESKILKETYANPRAIFLYFLLE